MDYNAINNAANQYVGSMVRSPSLVKNSKYIVRIAGEYTLVEFKGVGSPNEKNYENLGPAIRLNKMNSGDVFMFLDYSGQVIRGYNINNGLYCENDASMRMVFSQVAGSEQTVIPTVPKKVSAPVKAVMPKVRKHDRSHEISRDRLNDEEYMRKLWAPKPEAPKETVFVARFSEIVDAKEFADNFPNANYELDGFFHCVIDSSLADNFFNKALDAGANQVWKETRFVK